MGNLKIVNSLQLPTNLYRDGSLAERVDVQSGSTVGARVWFSLQVVHACCYVFYWFTGGACDRLVCHIVVFGDLGQVMICFSKNLTCLINHLHTIYFYENECTHQPKWP